MAQGIHRQSVGPCSYRPQGRRAMSQYYRSSMHLTLIYMAIGIGFTRVAYSGEVGSAIGILVPLLLPAWQ
jgi:hypothetical protein